MSELPTADATQLLEDAAVEAIATGEHPSFPDGLQLGVQVRPGRSKLAWPANYVAVNGDDQEPKHAEAGLWMVNATIWCVTDTEEKDAVATAAALKAKMVRWLRPGCPLIRWGNEKIFIHGLTVSGPVQPVRRDFTYADVIPVRFAVRVY